MLDRDASQPGSISRPLVVYTLDPLLAVLEECWRVLQPEGEIDAKFPVPSMANQWGDLTHYRQLSPAAFNMLKPGTDQRSVNSRARFTMRVHEVQGGNHRITLVKA